MDELKRRILEKRPICELCNKNMATQLHHCLVHDMKRFHDLLTVEENLMPVCAECHTGLGQIANGYKVRRAFAYRQVKRGLHVSEWYRSLPLKYYEAWLLNFERDINEH